MAQAKTITLGVKQLNRPSDLQLRENLDTDHINELAEVLKAGGELPPVKVVREANCYWLWDGHHTAAAHETAGINEIKAEVTREGDRRAAQWLACSANADHGLKRSNQTKRRQVEAALKLAPEWSDRKVAEYVQVSADLVGDVRSTVGIDSSAERTGRDGKTRTTKKKKSTKKKAAQPRSQGNGASGGGSGGGAGKGSEAASEGDGIDAMRKDTKPKQGAEKVSAKERKEVHRSLGRIVQFLDAQGRLTQYRQCLEAIHEEVEPGK